MITKDFRLFRYGRLDNMRFFTFHIFFFKIEVMISDTRERARSGL